MAGEQSAFGIVAVGDARVMLAARRIVTGRIVAGRAVTGRVTAEAAEATQQTAQTTRRGSRRQADLPARFTPLRAFDALRRADRAADATRRALGSTPGAAGLEFGRELAGGDQESAGDQDRMQDRSHLGAAPIPFHPGDSAGVADRAKIRQGVVRRWIRAGPARGGAVRRLTRCHSCRMRFSWGRRGALRAARWPLRVFLEVNLEASTQGVAGGRIEVTGHAVQHDRVDPVEHQARMRIQVPVHAHRDVV